MRATMCNNMVRHGVYTTGCAIILHAGLSTSEICRNVQKCLEASTCIYPRGFSNFFVLAYLESESHGCATLVGASATLVEPLEPGDHGCTQIDTDSATSSVHRHVRVSRGCLQAGWGSPTDTTDCCPFCQGTIGHSDDYWLLPWSCTCFRGRRIAVDEGLLEMWSLGP